MDVRKIVAELDAEIASLQQARAALMALDESVVVLKARRGRPKGSSNAAKAASVKVAKATPRKRNLSPEGRKRIADAMKRRWADRRKALKKEAAPRKELAVKK
jgi:hypothetical protein